MTRNVVSLSGGKDSVALWLWARRTGLDPLAVYIDTGWEWDGHHKHLDLLEARIGPITRIQAAETFEAVTRRKGTFPSRVRKWCTEELKLEPFRDWLNTYRTRQGVDVEVLLGIRRDESPSRADALEREWSDFYDCWVARPLVEWTVEQVIAEHRRAAIPMHPLYHHGAERVGCFPCVNASKRELALVAELAPERVDLIAAMEADIGATMFTHDRRAEKLKALAAGEEGGPSVEPVGIHEIMAWAQTSRGGRQLVLFQPPSGCARWAMCEAPEGDAVGGGA